MSEAPQATAPTAEWPLAWMPVFLDSLSRIPNVSAACRAANISRTVAYGHRDGFLYPDGSVKQRPTEGFAEAWHTARETALDLMESRAHEWAMVGVETRRVTRVTVVERDPEGNVIRETTTTNEVEGREQSASIMQFLLRAFRPHVFGQTMQLRHSGENGGPIRHEDVSARQRTPERMLDLLRLKMELEPAAASALLGEMLRLTVELEPEAASVILGELGLVRSNGSGDALELGPGDVSEESD